MATTDEIKSNVLKLQNAGAPPEKIRQYVSLASKELSPQSQMSAPPSSPQQDPLYVPPPGTAKSQLKALLPKVEDVPEIAGTTIGALIGNVPGAALGGAAGVAVKQLGQRAGILPGKPPETSSEAFKDIGYGSLRGTLAEAGGQLTGKFLTPFSSGITAQTKAGIEAAKRAGIEPPLSSMTQAKVPQALERFAEFSPFGGFITRQKTKSLQQLEKFADNISSGISPDLPPEVIGSNVSGKVKLFETSFKKAKDELYEPINKVLSDKPVDPKNTISAIEDVLERRAGGKEGKALLESFLERLRPGSSEAIRARGRYLPAKEAVEEAAIPGLAQSAEVLKESVPGKFIGSGGSLKTASDIPSMLVPKELPLFKQLKAIRSEVGARGQFNDPGVVGMKSDLEYIYSAASKDMDDVATQYGMGGALKAANEQYSKGIRKLQDSLINAFNKGITKSPENLHKIAIRRDAPTLIKQSREILGEDGFNQIRKQWFDDLIQRSKSVVDGDEIISPQKLATNIKNMGSSLDEITAGDKVLAQKLADLSDVSKLLTRGTKVTSGSQTGFILSTLKDIRGILSAPLLATEVGREYLTTGFPVLGKVATRGVQPIMSSGLQKVKKKEKQ